MTYQRPSHVGMRAGVPRRWAASVTLCALFFITSAHPAQGAGVVGTGTPESCTEAALDAALVGGGVVTFDCGPEPATITLTSEKVIADGTARTIVDGGGLVTLSGGNAVRVFRVNGGATLDVRNLTIADGFRWGGFNDGGGGIHNEGTLTVHGCTFAGNSSDTGGGIFNGGRVGGALLTVSESTFVGNSGRFGGGIFNNAADGTMTVRGSTFAGNSAVQAIACGGGGIANFLGTMLVASSTFLDNKSVCPGGGIYHSGSTMAVVNSTFDGNDSGIDTGPGTWVANSTFVGNGTGIFTAFGPAWVVNSTFDGNDSGIAGEGQLTVSNTIIANSTYENCRDSVIDGGHNLQWPGTDCGETIPSLDRLLDPAGLADNGGPTQTIALLAGSPAIDAGDSEVCANPPVNGLDQRGYVRPGVGHTVCSIGAYEADAIPVSACVGDCDGDGTVAVNELILGVDIALGEQPLGACPAFMNAEGMVDIAQLITGVNNALGSCGAG